jgi:CRP-like cAMP-binding protein
MSSGASAETAAVGNEGMVGVALITGADSTASSCTVHTAGQAWRLHGSVLRQAFREDGRLRALLLRYLHCLINQTILTAACHRHHSIDQQLSRCLLLTADRTDAAAPVMTQALVASVLGVSPDSIALAAAKLRAAGFISYRRGHLAMLDRQGLESVVCECYAADRRERARLRAAGRPRQGGAARENASARH